ncbi:MAG: inositol monophosphatase family protein [candidate division Zixibacteria bacterium]|nr:inositol monophosphatase family protein [candidate division Zixibacteria bacterium]
MSEVSGKLLKSLAAFANKTAIGAGKILAQGFSQRKNISYKSRIDPVTQFDLMSEKFIVSRIAKKFPDHGVLTEEGSARPMNDVFRWIIDPLDGTVNFAHGFPIYCVSIGLEFDDEIIVGAVYDSERKELFRATLGEGAFVNSSRLAVSKEKNLERALIATGFAYDISTSKKNNLGYFGRMAKKAQGVRRPGSAALDLCWLAAGRVDGFWELKLHPWDTAAATLIVTEAGGKLSRINSETYSIYKDDLLASNGHLHDKMRAVLKGR